MRPSKPLLVFVLALALSGVLRGAFVVLSVPVHNDERHYALDGLWTRADLPLSQRWSVLIYDHLRPHSFFNPKTGKIAAHGEHVAGYRRPDDDLGRVARSGHSGFYPLLLSAVFWPFSTEWLLASDRCVYIARCLHVLFDLGMLALVGAMLLRTVGPRLACAVAGSLALVPFVVIYGSLAYLDAPATFAAVLAAWCYVCVARREYADRHWVAIGLAAAAAVLVKQSNLVVLGLMPGLWLVARPAYALRKVLRGVAVAALAFGLLFVSVTNPFALYEETRYPVMPETRLKFTVDRVQKNLAHPFHPKRHYHVGTERHPGYDAPIGSVWLTRLYELTTPLLFAVFAGTAAVLLARGSWQVGWLLACMLGFAAFIPMGSVARRLYVLVPFVALVIGWGAQAVARGRTMPFRAGQ